MAAQDEELKKRSRKLETDMQGRKPNAADAQMLANQVQAIQDERQKNLALERAALSQEQQNLSTMAMAGEAIGDASVGPSTQAVLGKYGLSQPRVQRSQGHEVKVTPSHITINNTTNTTTTNNVKAEGGSQGGSNSGQSKFKAWVSNAFAAQKEQSIARSRDFDKREWSLTRSANKMLRKMEEVGKSVVDGMNPQNLGQTVGGQLKTLLFLFGMTFLAKHWTKVLKAVAWVGDKIKSGLDYFGITDTGKQLAAAGKGFKADFIAFFGGNVRKGDTIGSVLLRLGKDLIDYLKMKFEHSMEERGAAIKAIKFPSLDLTNIGGTLAGIAGYLGSILTAMVDPKKGIQASLLNNVKASGMESSNRAMKESRGPGIHTSMAGLKNTDTGDYALEGNINGKRRNALLETAIDSTGNLNKDAASQISQGRDLIGALEESKETGRIDVARAAAGLGRLEEAANSQGSVIVDKEFIEKYYGLNNANNLINSGVIKRVPMKYIRVPKEEVDYTSENANGFIGGYEKAAAGNAILNSLGVESGATKGAIIGRTFGSSPISGAFLGALPGGETLTNISAGIDNWENRLSANEYKLKLVPQNDPRPAVEIGGKKQFFNYYRLTPQAIQALQSIYQVKSFDASKDAQVLNRLQDVLINYGGGQQAVNQRFAQYKKKHGNDKTKQYDFDISKNTEELREMQEMQYRHKAEEDAFWNNSSLGATERSISSAASSIVNGINSGIGWVNEQINKFTPIKNQSDTTGAKLYVHPPQAIDSGKTFDAGRAAAGLTSRAGGNPSGYCAKYVRYAIEDGLGLNRDSLSGQLGNAKDFAGTLYRYGFSPVPFENYQPQVGDILVEPGYDSKTPYGHVSMFNGKQWISDYYQRDMWGGPGYRYYKTGVILRNIRATGTGELDAGTYLGPTSYIGGDTGNASFASGGAINMSGSYGGWSGSVSIGGGSTGSSSRYTPSKITVRADRGQFFTEHRARWFNVLKRHGYSDADASRLSVFFSAQDGVESGGGTSNPAKNFNNFGGMSGAKGLLKYNSVEDYMEAKLDMMKRRFGNSMNATNLQDFIIGLGTQGFNRDAQGNSFLYYNAKDDKLGRTQDQLIEDYVGGALSFAKSGGIQVETGSDYDPSFGGLIPTISNPIKSPQQLDKERRVANLRSEVSKLWSKYPELHEVFSNITEFQNYWMPLGKAKRKSLMDGYNVYHNHKKAIEANEETAGIGIHKFAEQIWAKHKKDGWSYINEWEANNRYNKRAGYSKTFTSKEGNREWMLKHTKNSSFNLFGIDKTWYAREGAKDSYDRIMNGKANQNETPELMAGVMFGNEYIGMENRVNEIDDEIRKLGTPGYMSQADMEKREKLLKEKEGKVAKMKYMKDAAVRYQSDVKSGKGTKIEKQHAYNKAMKSAKLGSEIEDIRKRKKEITDEVNRKLAELQRTGQTTGPYMYGSKEQTELILAYQKELESLNEKQKSTMKAYRDMVNSAVGTERKVLEESLKAEKLKNTSLPQIKSAFDSMLDQTGSYVESINKLIEEFGEGVIDTLAKIWNIPGLSKEDFNFDRDLLKEDSDSEGLRKKAPGVARSEDAALESAIRMKAIMDKMKAKGKEVNPIKYQKVLDEIDVLKKKKMKRMGGFDFTNPYDSGVTNYHSTASYATMSKEDAKGTNKFGVSTYGTYALKLPGKAEGGWTADVSPTEIAGVVHGGEYVIPSGIIPKAKGMINQLEKMRKINSGRLVVDNRKTEDKKEFNADPIKIQSAVNNSVTARATADTSGKLDQTNQLLAQIAGLLSVQPKQRAQSYT